MNTNIKSRGRRFFSNIALFGAALFLTGCATNDSYAGGVSIGINVPLGNGVSSTITYGTGHGNIYYNNGYSSHYYRASPPPIIHNHPGYVYQNRSIVINNGHYGGYYDNRPIIIDNRNYNKHKSPRPVYVVPKDYRHDRRDYRSGHGGVWR